MTTPSNSANTGSQPGYSMPAYSTGSQPGLQGGYPPANSGNYPAGGYPYGAPSGTSYPGNYPASGYPGASYGPSSAGGYAGSPSAGTNMAAGYNAAVSGNVPQVGAAQFQGSIEKPSNVQASYDSTRPSLY